MVRIIVAGGRDFEDYQLMKATLDETLSHYDVAEIISGHAKGADLLGEQYAKDNGIACSVFPADWKKDWKRAGFIRNNQMIDYAAEGDPLLVAFWDGNSHGTKDIIEKAMARNIECIVVDY